MIEYQELVGDEMFANRKEWVTDLTAEDNQEVRNQIFKELKSDLYNYKDEVVIYMQGVHKDEYELYVDIDEYITKREFESIQGLK